MIIKTKEFKEVANTILLATAVDKSKISLELAAKKGNLYLNTTNKEFYVAVKFPLDEVVEFRAVVEAQAFLNLISGITAPEFELLVDEQKVTIKVGKSQYKIPLIYENTELMTLKPIRIGTVTAEMPIDIDILKSILNVNSKELLKLKNAINVSEVSKLYYIDETGCYTFTTGACKNSFHLEKPIKLLLNDRIIKLFKLFDESVYFKFGFDQLANGTPQQKVSFETENIYVAAIVTCDEILLNKFPPAINALKDILETSYSSHIVVSAADVASALNRLMQFTKNTVESADLNSLIGTFTFTDNEMLIADDHGNVEAIDIENGSYVGTDYTMLANLNHLKLVVDSCKNDHITINFGNGKAIVINRGTITNYLPEVRQKH